MKEELLKYGEVLENIDLKDYNTYKVSCIAKTLIIPLSIHSLSLLIKYLNENNINYIILGNGSNILLGNKDYDGIYIKLSKINKIEYNNEEVNVEAGAMLNTLAIDSISKNLTGLEWASGIPGTIGGSIVGNAGAYKDDISNYLKIIKVIDEKGHIIELYKDDITFDYRDSSLKKEKYIVVSAILELKKGDLKSSLEVIKERTKRRLDTQPLEYPSAGSVFRNPDNDYAGRLIEECGLKGYVLGGAKVSTKHANFIINYDNATNKDIYDLINLVHDKVKEKFNIDLKIEQQFINWE